MIPFAIDYLIISDDALWQSVLKDVHGLPKVDAQLVERFGRWPALSSMKRAGRRFSLVTLWSHATPALRAAAKRQLEQYLNPEREAARRLIAANSVLPDMSPSSVLLALGPWNVARSGTTYAPRNLVNDDMVVISGGVLFYPGILNQAAILVAEGNAADGYDNLIKNPSFEIDTTNWSMTAGSISRSTAWSQFGSACALVHPNAAQDGATCDVTNETSASTVYTLSAYVKVGVQQTIRLSIYDDGTGGEQYADTVVSPGAAVRLKVTATFGNGSQRRVYIRSMQGYDFYLDAVKLERRSHLVCYGDGSLGQGHAWSSTAHNSRSTRTVGNAYYVLSAPATWSVCFWAYRHSDETIDYGYLFGNGNNYSSIYYNGNHDVIATVDAGAPSDGWHHYAITYDGTTTRAFRDGVLKGSHTHSLAVTDQWYIGCNSSYAGNTLVDDFMILNAALTCSQLATLYARSAPVYRWCNVIGEEVKAYAIGGEETDQGVVSTLVVDGDVRWRSRDGATFWRVYGDTGSVIVNNGGDDDAYPVVYITPKSIKSGNTWSYKRWCPIIWRATGAGTQYPIALTLDTAALVTAGKMQADGDDLRVKVDGLEVDRWLDSMDTASTKVWFNANWQATASATAAAIGSLTSTTITATTDISGFPSSGILLVDSEAIIYTGKSNTDKQFTGCARGAKGTTAATHSAGATIYWIQHDVWVLYGNSSASAPTVNDNYKPAFELSSTNTSWTYAVFGEEDGLRTAAWVFSKSGSNPTKYTANHATDADPWQEIGVKLYMYYPDYGAWSLYNVCGMTQFSCPNNAIERNVYDAAYWDAKIQQSPDGSTWTTAYAIAEPSPVQTWVAVATGPTQALAAGTKYLQLYLAEGSNNVGRWLYVEISDLTVTLDSAYTPTVAVNAEQFNYDLNVTLTNATTGEAIQLALAMQIDQTIEIDTDAKTITLLSDNSRQMQALTLVGGARADWLRLAVGENTLQWSDTGTTNVEVEILFDRRYFE